MAYVRNASKKRKKINKNKVYNSMGPKGKVRGLAHQVVDKYNNYAMDAKSSDDPALMHAYFQYAEHYQNILNDIQEYEDEQKQQNNNNHNNNHNNNNRGQNKNSNNKNNQKERVLENA